MLVILSSKHKPLAEILSYLKIWSNLRKTVQDGSFHFYSFILLENILKHEEHQKSIHIPGMYKSYTIDSDTLRSMCLDMFLTYSEYMTPDKKSAFKKILFAKRYIHNEKVLMVSQGEYDAFGKKRGKALWRMVTRVLDVEVQVRYTNRAILRA